MQNLCRSCLSKQGHELHNVMHWILRSCGHRKWRLLSPKSPGWSIQSTCSAAYVSSSSAAFGFATDSVSPAGYRVYGTSATRVHGSIFSWNANLDAFSVEACTS
jgi:hypothetical protein